MENTHRSSDPNQRKDLKNAMLELKEIPLFHEEKTESFESLIDKSFSNHDRKSGFIESDKSGKDLINEIFSAVNKLKTSPPEDLDDDESFD